MRVDYFDRFVPEGHVPNSKLIKDVYSDSLREFAQPFPSVKFKDFPKFNEITGGFRPNSFSTKRAGTRTTPKTKAEQLGGGSPRRPILISTLAD